MDIRSKNINTSRVLRLIALNRGISRVEIAQNLQVDKSTITFIVNRLLKRNVVIETEALQAGVRGGRRPVALAINGDYGAVLGLEVQSQFYRLVGLDLHGEVIYTENDTVPLASDNLVTTVSRITKRVQSKLAKKGLPVLGIGLGVSGVVNYHQGVVYNSIPLDIDAPLPVLEHISEELDVPIFVENDANCVGWGELAFHRPRLLRDFLCVLLRRWRKREMPDHYSTIGVGLGVVINGKVHHGQGYSAGEFRSIQWRNGNRGQFSMPDEHLESIHQDELLFRRFGNELAQHLAFLVNTFNLSHVTLSGAFAEGFEALGDQIETAIAENWPYDGPVDCEILTAAHGEDVVAYGAAGMVLERIFEHPEVPDGASMQIPNGLSILMDR